MLSIDSSSSIYFWVSYSKKKKGNGYAFCLVHYGGLNNNKLAKLVMYGICLWLLLYFDSCVAIVYVSPSVTKGLNL